MTEYNSVKGVTTLTKYCDEKYNVNNPECKSIQIGSLDYYRNSENQFISDGAEGSVKGIRFVGNPDSLIMPPEMGYLLWLSVAHPSGLKGF